MTSGKQISYINRFISRLSGSARCFLRVRFPPEGMHQRKIYFHEQTKPIPDFKDLSLKNNPRIFILGDQAHIPGDNNLPLPAIAPVALQQGRFTGHTILDDLNARTGKPFFYYDKGLLATTGRNKAILQKGKFEFKGLPAWIIWPFIHIYYLIGFIQELKTWSFGPGQRSKAMPLFFVKNSGARIQNFENIKWIYQYNQFVSWILHQIFSNGTVFPVCFKNKYFHFPLII